MDNWVPVLGYITRHFNSYMFTMYAYNSSYNLRNAGFLTSAFNICYIYILSTFETQYMEFSTKSQPVLVLVLSTSFNESCKAWNYLT